MPNYLRSPTYEYLNSIFFTSAGLFSADMSIESLVKGESGKAAAFGALSLLSFVASAGLCYRARQIQNAISELRARQPQEHEITNN